MASLDDFIPYVGNLLPQANEHMVRLAVENAIVRFMRDTMIWRDQVQLEGQDCVTEYFLDVPECREIVSVNMPQITVNGCPARAVRDGHSPVVMFDCAPPEGACIIVPYSWSITRNGCDVPDELVNNYMDAIRFLAAVELWSAPGPERDRMSRVSYYEAKYQQELLDVKARNLHNFSRQRTTMRNPFRRRRTTW